MMIFGVEHLAWYCSQFFIMVRATSSLPVRPRAWGSALKPEPTFLKAADVVTLGIAGLGAQTPQIKPFSG
jgi:ureidoglycolate lyase